MNIEEIMFAEVNGICDTIDNYSREHFVRNYTKIFRALSYPEDQKKIVMVVYRLFSWYADEIKEIRKSEYIYNKHEHEKSRDILKQLLNYLLKE